MYSREKMGFPGAWRRAIWGGVIILMCAGCVGIPRSTRRAIDTHADALVIVFYDENEKEIPSLRRRFTTTRDMARGMGAISRRPAQMPDCKYTGKLLFVDEQNNRILFEGKFSLARGHIVTSDGDDVRSRQLSEDGVAFLSELAIEKTVKTENR